jgi:hypothetical protein
MNRRILRVAGTLPVRLDKDFFDFNEAQANGGDLRFAAACDGTREKPIRGMTVRTSVMATRDIPSGAHCHFKTDDYERMGLSMASMPTNSLRC